MAQQNVTTIMPAPEGYVVDFDRPYQHAATTGYIVGGVGTALALATLVMRTYTRLVITRKVAAEDWLIIVAFVCGLVVQSLIFYLWATKTAGVHAWELPLERFNRNSLLTMIMSIFYVPALGGAKLSILFLYRRLSPVRWFRYCIYAVVAIVAAYSIAILFALIFPCKPISSNWDVTIEGKCVDKAQIYLATAGVNVATDMLILALPLPMVWRLQMPRLQKIGLCAVFAFGSATCITSVIRLVYMVPMVSNLDATYAVSVPLVWVEVEVNLVIIVCCLPALRHFLRRFAPGCIGESRNASDQYGSQTNPDLSGYGHKSISQITSRARRKNRDLDYAMMTRSDEDIELTRHEKDEKEISSVQEGLDKDAEKAIWTTKTFAVQ